MRHIFMHGQAICCRETVYVCYAQLHPFIHCIYIHLNAVSSLMATYADIFIDMLLYDLLALLLGKEVSVFLVRSLGEFSLAPEI